MELGTSSARLNSAGQWTFLTRVFVSLLAIFALVVGLSFYAGVPQANAQNVSKYGVENIEVHNSTTVSDTAGGTVEGSFVDSGALGAVYLDLAEAPVADSSNYALFIDGAESAVDVTVDGLRVILKPSQDTEVLSGTDFAVEIRTGQFSDNSWVVGVGAVTESGNTLGSDAMMAQPRAFAPQALAAAQPTTVAIEAPAKANVGEKFNVIVKVTPTSVGGTVTLTPSAGNPLTAPVINGQAIIAVASPIAGKYTLDASFAPNDPNYAPSKAQQVAIDVVDPANTTPGITSGPDVFGTPGLRALGSGDSKANLAGTKLTVSTAKQSDGKVQEIQFHTDVPGFTGTDGWVLKINGAVVDPSRYTLRVDSDDVFITLKEAQEYPIGTRFEVTGGWVGNSFSGGAMTLWGPEPSVPTNAYSPLELAARSLTCNQISTTRFQVSARLKTASDIYVLAAFIPESVTMPTNAQDPSIEVTAYISGKKVTLRNGVDFTVTLTGRYISATLTNPILGADGIFQVSVANNNRKLGSVPGCQLQLLGISGATTPTDIPQVCSETQRPIDDNGTPMPWSGDGTPVSPRKAPRALTPAEVARGTSVYVTASTPNGQNRYFSQLYYQEQAGTAFQKIGGETGWVINALAYNPADNWLYAVSQGRVGNHTVRAGSGYQYVPLEDPCFPAGHLLQIDPSTGQVYNLGKIANPSDSSKYGIGGDYNKPWPNDLWGGVNSGFIDKNGNFWATNSSLSGSGHFYNINLNSVTAAIAGAGASPYQKCGNNEANYCSRSEDWTVLPDSVGAAGNYAWGIKNGWAANNRVVLLRMNMNDGSITEFDITDKRTITGQAIPTGHQWGKAWTYGNGNLGFGTASSGASSDIVQIKVTNPDSASPKFELVSVDSTAPRSYNSNGTSNGLVRPLDVDLEAIKKFVKEDPVTGRLHWRIDIANLSSTVGSSGFTVEDKFPNGHTNITVEKTSGATASVKIGPDALQVIFGPLPAGQSASVEFSAQPPAGTAKTCAVNVASVLGNEEDPNPNNNTSKAEQCPEISSMKIQLRKVGLNDTSTFLDADFEVREAVGDTLDKLVPSNSSSPIKATKDGTSNQVEVKTNTYYFLTETRSPSGYSLLPERILIFVDADVDGKPKLTFPMQAENAGFPVLKNDITEKDGVIIIPVADVNVGNLPRTGGPGLVGYLISAMLLIGAALGLRRKLA